MSDRNPDDRDQDDLFGEIFLVKVISTFCLLIFGIPLYNISEHVPPAVAILLKVVFFILYMSIASVCIMVYFHRHSDEFEDEMDTLEMEGNASVSKCDQEPALVLARPFQKRRAGDYSQLEQPLPDPPTGMQWIQNVDTKEWQLVNMTTLDVVVDIEEGEMLVEDDFQDETEIVEATAVEDESTKKLPATGLYHTIGPSDTFHGICIRYNTTALELRRANGDFSGTNLHLVPNPLTIPINEENHHMLSTAPLPPRPQI